MYVYVYMMCVVKLKYGIKYVYYVCTEICTQVQMHQVQCNHPHEVPKPCRLALDAIQRGPETLNHTLGALNTLNPNP